MADIYIPVSACNQTNLGCSCSPSSPCPVGEGTCVSDSDCADDLGCGRDNCGDYHNNVPTWFDCCMGESIIAHT